MNEIGSKKQIVLIHGGDSYSSYNNYLADLKSLQIDYQQLLPAKRWKDKLAETFVDYDVLMPTMPNSANAQFSEWQIWFDKLTPFFGNNVRLIGHSLGAMFLAKYLHANRLKSPVEQLILIAGGYDMEDYGSFTVSSAAGLEQSAKAIHLFHSSDDPVVSYTELAKYQSDLPGAHTHNFNDRGHFNNKDFPELIKLLQD